MSENNEVSIYIGGYGGEFVLGEINEEQYDYWKTLGDEALESYAIEQIGQRRRDEYQDGEVRAHLNVKPPSSYGNK